MNGKIESEGIERTLTSGERFYVVPARLSYDAPQHHFTTKGAATMNMTAYIKAMIACKILVESKQLKGLEGELAINAAVIMAENALRAANSTRQEQPALDP